MTDDATLLAAARELLAAGCSVVPVRPDATKAPAVFWARHQLARPVEAQLASWFREDAYDGLGVVCGERSGQLEMLELEGRAVQAGIVQRLAALLADHDLAGLWGRLNTGYLELTPSGGLHWLYRVTDGPAARNLKLARRPGPEGVEVLVETRGEGGFVVLAPSGGRSHPTGGAWRLLAGGPATIPTLTVDERDALHAICRLLDEMPPAPDAEPAAPPPGAGGHDQLRPGDDYNARTSWAELLEPYGWRVARPLGGGLAWRRPGKAAGISATTGTRDGDRLYVFSTSTPFDTERPYSKFGAYAVLEHDGDHAAAARALRAAGYGAQAAREHDLAGILGAGARPAAASSPDADPPVTTAVIDGQTVTLTDDGNAIALVRLYGDRIRYVPERGRWLRWGGSHWAWDDAGHVVELAKATVRAFDTVDGDVAKHRHRSLSRRGIEAMVALARTDPAVVAPAALLDADPYALCTPSGVVDLTTGVVKPPDPADLHTRATSVPCDPTLPTPRWTAFLDDTFGGDQGLIAFVQRLAGYSATGAVTHHVLPFLHGPGGNGKSVFLDVIRRVLGDYAATAPAGFLMSTTAQHETEVARLAGLRFVICSEVNQEDRFDEAKVKLLTGGDALTARFMRQDHFTFVPTHHLWLMGNHQPRVSSGGQSFWRRLRLVPFTHTVPPERKIEGLDKLIVDEEGPGILAWIVNGAIAAARHGLAEPAAVTVATAAYATEEDALARFLDDCCHIGGGHHVKIDTAELRKAYEFWCREEGERPLPPQALGRELRTRLNIDQARSHGRRYYLGMTLLTPPAAADPDESTHWTDR